MGQSVRQARQPTTVNDHMRELVMRLFFSAMALLVVSAVVYFYYAPILAFLSAPLGAPLYYSTPAGSFSFVMKICFMGSLTVTIPILVYNLIMFIRPAFKQAIPLKRVYLTGLFSGLLAIAGAVFAFTCILPGSLSFFAGFRVDGLKALISADSYLGFVTNIIITFVIVFQIPLLIAFIDRIKPIQPKKLIKMEKWVVAGSLIVALLAPFTYDLVTSLLIALPIVVLYNLSIVMVVMRHAKIARREKAVIHSVVVRPSMELSDISVDELVYEQLADELACLAKPAPRVISNYTPDNAYLDLKPQEEKQEITAPTWALERNARRAAVLATQVHVFSDFRRPSSNRALAS